MQEPQGHTGLSPGAIAGIVIGVISVVTLAAIGVFVCYKRQYQTKHKRALETTIAMGSVPPGTCRTGAQFSESNRNKNEVSASVFPPHNHETTRVWDDWIAQTSPRPPPGEIIDQSVFIHNTPTPQHTTPPWMTSRGPAALDRNSTQSNAQVSRITDIASSASPMELELAQDAQRGRVQDIMGPTSGPLAGPAGSVSPPASPPARSRNLLQRQRVSDTTPISISQPPSPTPDFTRRSTLDELFISPTSPTGGHGAGDDDLYSAD
ncbi:hypothetical protein M430DRAFT_51818 [Amorphotheca resinae ATCC 22711]|jgi:hypothetical protein|uniref:Uncharacterized protein n=1 Tax=Amorphotheca resinae ATCC 22711 TaxID=857342 RepID=A0A2T3AYN9_AMORE|nr:hypothetical protein M430DRAFT_51818 [Amorphotheca resinae ATCC 22711]PSS15195.1 hypothetical protein M430DRAFT_51818 [Amorphotheca resinae ATCC 22711]